MREKPGYRYNSTEGGTFTRIREKKKASPRKAKMKNEDAADTAPAAAEPQLLPWLQQVLLG